MSASLPLEEGPRGVSFRVKVHPRARRNGLDGIAGDTLKLSVTAVAEQGKANRAVLELLAEVLKIPQRQFSILSGETNPRKSICVSGVPRAELAARLAAALAS